MDEAIVEELELLVVEVVNVDELEEPFEEAVGATLKNMSSIRVVELTGQ